MCLSVTKGHLRPNDNICIYIYISGVASHEHVLDIDEREKFSRV